MPWVRLDDRFPSHRKVALLSDRAFRLHVSALCWCSENLTEGKILDSELSVIARLRGIKAAAKELEERQLWDRVDDGWMIHDYLEYNPDRVKVQKQREDNAARQQAWRDRKKAEREAKRAAEEAVRNATRNGVTRTVQSAENDATATRTRHDGDTNLRENDAANRSSSQVNEIRNAASNGTPSPTPASSTSYGSTAMQGGELASIMPVRIPAWVQPLIDALNRRGINVSWTRLADNQWFAIQQLMNARGIDSLVNAAASRWNPRDPIKYASLLLTIWLEQGVPSPDSSPTSNDSAQRDPRAAWPAWCRDPDCDERTRLRDVETDDGLRYSAPCPNCHPSRKDAA